MHAALAHSFDVTKSIQHKWRRWKDEFPLLDVSSALCFAWKAFHSCVACKTCALSETKTWQLKLSSTFACAHHTALRTSYKNVICTKYGPEPQHQHEYLKLVEKITAWKRGEGRVCWRGNKFKGIHPKNRFKKQIEDQHVRKSKYKLWISDDEKRWGLILHRDLNRNVYCSILLRMH